MAIKQVYMYSLFCNDCDKLYIHEETGVQATLTPDSIAELATDDNWHVQEAKCRQKTYCPDCIEEKDTLKDVLFI